MKNRNGWYLVGYWSDEPSGTRAIEARASGYNQEDLDSIFVNMRERSRMWVFYKDDIAIKRVLAYSSKPPASIE